MDKILITIIGVGSLIFIAIIVFLYKEIKKIKKQTKKEKKPSFAFLIGMYVSLIPLFLLIFGGYKMCESGYCKLSTMFSLLSSFSIIVIGYLLVRLCIPLFLESGYIESKKIRTKNGEVKIERKARKDKYLSYVILLVLSLLFLFFMVPDILGERVKVLLEGDLNFLFENEDTKKIMQAVLPQIIRWLFYIIGISGVLGSIGSIRIMGKEADIKLNEFAENKKIHELKKKLNH